MKYCIVCRQAFLEPDFFCPTHGLRLRTTEEDQVKQCFGCGSILEQDERFCRRCGFEVNDADWPSDAAGEASLRDAREGESEPKQAWQRARESNNPPNEDDSLRLRPFRGTGLSPQRRKKRARRGGRIGILLVAAIISLSVIAWHAFDLDPTNLAGQFNLFPSGAAPPANLEQSDRPAAPHTETDVAETEQQAQPPQSLPPLGLSEETKGNDLTQPELAHGAVIPPAPVVEMDNELDSDVGKVAETVGRAEPDTQSNNAKRPAKKTSAPRVSKDRSPVVSPTARARVPSPEEIQRQREAERKRVQREIEEAIANRGVSGVAVSFINGTVFLGGEVHTVTQREAAEQAARRVPEVRDVRSKISVKWNMDGRR